jgi:hypothetical protein
MWVMSGVCGQENGIMSRKESVNYGIGNTMSILGWL